MSDFFQDYARALFLNLISFFKIKTTKMSEKEKKKQMSLAEKKKYAQILVGICKFNILESKSKHKSSDPDRD